MKRLPHKYFRNQKYKDSLIQKYRSGGNEYYPGCVRFLTKVPATNIKNHNVLRWGSDIYWNACHGRYEYWEMPDVPFTVIEEVSRRSLKEDRTRRNRQLRHNCSGKYFKNPQKSEYKKLYEFWWIVD